MVATERPDQLLWMVEMLRGSGRGRVTVLQLAADCGVELDYLAATIGQAARDLDSLRSQSRRRWRHPGEIVDSPNVAALHILALARARRCRGGSAALRTMLKLSRRLLDAHATERRRNWILEFIHGNDDNLANRVREFVTPRVIN